MSNYKQEMNSEILLSILNDYGIEIKYDELLHREEVYDTRGMLNDSETPLKTLVAIICEEYRGDYKYCTRDLITQSLHRIAVSNRSNPILEEIKRYARMDYDSENDFISEVSHDLLRIPTEDTFSHLLVRKLFMQSVAMLQNSSASPFGADGLVVFVGDQGIGKSLAVNCFSIYPRYYRSICLNAYSDETDILCKAHGVFIGELSEIERSLKPSTVEMFKDFITSGKDSYRPKYGDTVNDYIRHATFIGTCNTKTFLIDRTGNRRFWVIPCPNQFNIKRLVRCKSLEDTTFIRAYAQAYNVLEKDGLQSFRLTEQEREILEKRNSSFMYSSDCEQTLKGILLSERQSFFTIAELKASHEELTAYDNNQIGRILTSRLMLPQKSHKVVRTDGTKTTERLYTNTLI